jgi:hypothetical protein
MKNLVEYHRTLCVFGGCIVHGINEETMYHWKETIGDITERPVHGVSGHPIIELMVWVIMNFMNCANI